MKKWQAMLLVVLIFAAGMACGAGVAVGVVRNRVRKAVRGGPDAMRGLVLRRMTRELKLTDAQRVQAEAALLEAQGRMVRLRATYQPEVEQIVADGIERMKPHLTAEQNARLEDLYETTRARWQPKAPVAAAP